VTAKAQDKFTRRQNVEREVTRRIAANIAKLPELKDVV
jgi:hypothetical protein